MVSGMKLALDTRRRVTGMGQTVTPLKNRRNIALITPRFSPFLFPPLSFTEIGESATELAKSW
jgi:hypothetical protein